MTLKPMKEPKKKAQKKGSADDVSADRALVPRAEDALFCVAIGDGNHQIDLGDSWMVDERKLEREQ